MLRLAALAAGCAASTGAEMPPPEPRILSMVAGLPRCIGVPGIAEARAWGCPVVNVSKAGGGAPSEEMCGACMSPQQLGAVCTGQGMTNTTARDGTPVTFSLPVDMGSIKAEYFQWTLSDGRTTTAECAMPRGAPAAEANEQQTIAIVGDAGGWSTATVTQFAIVGPLMLVQPNGSKVSAEGLTYKGPALSWENGATLLDARLEAFSTAGETTHGVPVLQTGQFPNHCRVNFPSTTHRIRMLWDGGVSNDGRRSFNPDQTDLFRLRDGGGAELPAASVLGLADLGNAPAGSSAAERDGYKQDGDNYLDVCLRLGANDAKPTAVDVLCGEGTQIAMPKGLKKASNGLAPLSAPRCAPHTVSVYE